MAFNTNPFRFPTDGFTFPMLPTEIIADLKGVDDNDTPNPNDACATGKNKKKGKRGKGRKKRK